MSTAATNHASVAHAARVRTWLRRQPKRHLALFALLPVLLVLWLPIVIGRTPPGDVAARLAPAAGGDPVHAAPAGETDAGSLAVATVGAAAAFEQRVLELTRPFQPRWNAVAPPPPELAPKADAPPVSYSALVPSAILLSRGGDPVAIVRGRACRVGDVVEGSTIVAIEERRVVYREGGRTVAADMAGTPLGGR